MNDQKNMLMIFIRNARIGQVKTRLAATVGDEKALEIYVRLLRYTAEISRKITASKAVFYSEFIEELDEFEVPAFHKYLQQGNDLGDRMKNAFIKSFSRGYENVIIIGSDCYELNSSIIENAFEKLINHDVVIGPAKDGGYYLLGMKKLNPDFFLNKSWSTSNVFLDTLIDCQKNNLSYAVLDALNDIDEASDLTGDLKKFAE